MICRKFRLKEWLRHLFLILHFVKYIGKVDKDEEMYKFELQMTMMIFKSLKGHPHNTEVISLK
jgi:hypothetical protein